MVPSRGKTPGEPSGITHLAGEHSEGGHDSIGIHFAITIDVANGHKSGTVPPPDRADITGPDHLTQGCGLLGVPIRGPVYHAHPRWHDRRHVVVSPVFLRHTP